jgi:hypothetical protein
MSALVQSHTQVSPSPPAPIRGTARRKRRKLIKERACDEKAIDSKVKYLKSRPTKPELVLPSPGESVMPSSNEDFEVLPSTAVHARCY